jgi:hypothetical protein
MVRFSQVRKGKLKFTLTDACLNPMGVDGTFLRGAWLQLEFAFVMVLVWALEPSHGSDRVSPHPSCRQYQLPMPMHVVIAQ